MDGDRLWITVHESDDEAEQIWHDVVGVPMNRIQRMGDEDNFWQAGETGPCGPDSEIFVDRGPQYGPDGGPAVDVHGDRFMETWNLVFMQYDRDDTGVLTPLPNPSIDTGAGLERVLTVLQDVDSLWETDLMRPLIDKASELTGRTYKVGDYDDRDSFAIRVLAEHARSTAMLVADGVFPSNEARGYVLRRIIRRAVRYAYLLGTEQLVLPELADVAVDVMGNAYPDVARQREFIVGVLGKEEEHFRHTLRNGLAILERELDGEPATEQLSGSTAFALHDTYGFPLELTQEIASERGVTVDLAGFETEMAEQRRRAKAARGVHREHANVDAYRRIIEEHGVTSFLGYIADTAPALVLDVLDVSDGDGEGDVLEIFLDQTPFYAESGGQVGDTGTISTATGTAEVVDTTFALPNPAATRRASSQARSQPGRTQRRPSTRSVATTSAATTPPRTSCTRRCATSSVNTSSRPARSSPRIGCASTSPITRRSVPTRSFASSSSPMPRPWRTPPSAPSRRPGRRPRTSVRSPSSARSTAMSSAFSRREARSSCAAGRTSAPPATSARSRSSARDRSDRTCGASRRSPATAP
jgi:alanyl-tRNA synthetase